MNEDLLNPAQSIIDWCEAALAVASLTEKQTLDLQRIHRCAGTFTALVHERVDEIARLRGGEIIRPLLHELRNPLNCMIGYSDMMLSGFDGDLPAETRSLLKQAFEMAHSLNATIDRLAAAARETPPE
ncbi:MAG: hypothetical protein K8I60_01675 [Anaerolineae bacterium]|nr:hypothetical protein [Anaerolineae bacterium]